MANKIGISKKALLEDYYFDELSIVFEQYAELSKSSVEDEKVEECYWDELGI